MWEQYWLWGQYLRVRWWREPPALYDAMVDWHRWNGRKVLTLDAGTFLRRAPMFTTLDRFTELTGFETAAIQPATRSEFFPGSCTPRDIAEYGGQAPGRWIQVRDNNREAVLVRRPLSRILEHRIYPAKPRFVKPI